MHQLARAFLILLLAFVGSSRIGRAQEATDSAEAVRGIRAVLDDWVEAANRQDWGTAARVWAPDLVGWYPGQPDDTYAKEMERAANPKPGRPKTRYEVRVEEVMVSGPLAVVRDVWRFTTAPGKPDSSIAVVRGFEVWRRQADGHWKISRWISAPEAPAARAQSPGNRYINPPGLVKPNGYTHVVVAADGRTVYIAGQVAFDTAGKVVGEGDLKPLLSSPM